MAGSGPTSGSLRDMFKGLGLRAIIENDFGLAVTHPPDLAIVLLTSVANLAN